MDPICQKILIEKTKFEKIVTLFEICGFVDIDDLVDVDDEVVDLMEAYIHDYLSSQPDPSPYLDSGYIFTPTLFHFPMGHRFNIFEAIKLIQQESQQRQIQNSLTAGLQTPTKTEPTQPLEMETIENMVSLQIKNELCLEASEMRVDSKKQFSVNIERKTEILETWAASVIDRVSKKYLNATLEFKKDFDLDIEIMETSLEPKCSGLYRCFICRGLKGHPKDIKFSLSKEGYVILSNVITHLKQHFTAL